MILLHCGVSAPPCQAISPNRWVPLYEMSSKIDVNVNFKRYFHGPAMIVTPEGHWLLAHQDSATHSGHDGYITQMRSTDQGKTWASDGIVYDGRTQRRFGRNPLYGVTDAGVIVLLVQTFTPDRKRLPGDPSRAWNTAGTAWLTSSDDGKTYTPHGRVSKVPRARLTHAYGRRMLNLNGQLLMVSRQSSPKLAECGIWLYALDDPAKGWQRGPCIFTFKKKNEEIVYPALVYRPDVGLSTYAKSNDGMLRRISRDMGKTWGPVAKVNGLIVRNNAEMGYAGDVLFCHARGWDICSVVLYFSPNHGVHWGHPIVLERYGPRSSDGAYSASVPYGKDGMQRRSRFRISASVSVVILYR